MKAIGKLAFAIALASISGCYWSSPPSTPHRSVRFDVAAMPEISTPAPRPLVGGRVVVLGRFDSTAFNPIGGLYDRKDYSVSPLTRTYFFKDGAIEIFEHVSDGLRASGLNVLKDYGGHAEPALLEAPLRAKSPVLVTATVTALQHDQIKEKADSAEYEAGKVEIALKVVDSVDGGTKLEKAYAIEGRIRYDGQTEFLRLLGWKLAETLSRDPQFVSAISVKAQGS